MRRNILRLLGVSLAAIAVIMYINSIGDSDVPTAGTWTLTVTVRLDEFTALTADTTFPVR